MINRLCIIGVGLIGGSFASALKKNQQVNTIIGFEKNQDTLKKAKQLLIIDEYSADIATALQNVDMVLIATPVGSFQEILTLIKPHISSSVIITDVGSTKITAGKIAKQVFAKMPDNFIPAHPISGKEKNGIEAADANLFNNKLVILTPEKTVNTQSLDKVCKLWEALGANVQIMSANQHDDLLAMTSHLPHILAFTIMSYLINNNPDSFNYAAGGFKDFSRIASSSAVMWRDICINNTEYIVKHIKNYQQALDQVSHLIQTKDAQALEELFNKAKSRRDNWLKEQQNIHE